MYPEKVAGLVITKLRATSHDSYPKRGGHEYIKKAEDVFYDPCSCYTGID
jgi:hypothetical protein